MNCLWDKVEHLVVEQRSGEVEAFCDWGYYCASPIFRQFGVKG